MIYFRKYFGYQNPSFLAKDLHKVNQAENEKIVLQINDEQIDLRNAIIRK